MLTSIIVLYRNTLLLDWNEVKGEVDRYGSGEPWHVRLRNGPQICLEAARDMVSLQVTVSEAGEPSFLALGTSPLAAVYVFVIQIRRQPGSILTRTHSEVCLCLTFRIQCKCGINLLAKLESSS